MFHEDGITPDFLCYWNNNMMNNSYYKFHIHSNIVER